MRLCIIGPSHIAALREAERQGLVDTGACDITYFGHHTRVFGTLSLTGPRLRVLAARPVVPDLRIEADISEHDALFLCGVLPDTRWMLRHARLELADLRSISRGLAVRQLRKAIPAAPLFGVFAEIRSAFQGPILISPAPLKAGAEATAPAERELELFNAAAAEVLGELGFDFLPQPAGTVTEELSTRETYSVGSVKLRGDALHPEKDISHMNSAYGALVYREALARLQERGRFAAQ